MEKGQPMEALEPDLWRYRPDRIATHEFARLQGSLHYEKAVDDVTGLLRILKDKAAWIEWARRHLIDRSWNESTVLGKDVPRADDSFIRMWINGLSRHQALWLIKEKIPCFIIHSYTPADLDLHRIHDLPSIPSFVQWSEAELLKPESNGYEFVALKHGQIRRNIYSNQHISQVATTVNVVEPPRCLSISYNQGWSGVPGVTRLLYCFSPEQSLPPDLPPEDITTTASSDPPALPPSKFQLPSPVAEIVDKERSPWLVPPKVDDVNNRNWSRWEMSSNDEGKDCVRRLARRMELSGKIVYDRAHKRKIVLEGEAVVPAGVVAAEIHGFPGPDIPYEEQGNKGWKEVVHSCWLYFSQLPLPEQIGKSATRPEPDQLPFLPSVKGKAKEKSQTAIKPAPPETASAPIEEVSPGQNRPETQPDPTSGLPPSPAPTFAPIDNPRMNPSPSRRTAVPRPPDNQPSPPSTPRSPVTNADSTACPMALSSDEMVASSEGRAALVGKKEADPLGVKPVTNTASPASPTVLSSDEMIVSPQGRPVLVGKKHAEPLDILPVTNAASPARPAALSSDNMAVSHQGRAALVGRMDAGPLGVVETPLGSFVSPYLKLPDLHIDMQWNDLMASLEAASLLMDYPVMDLAAQTVQNGQKTFWLCMHSVSDALKARGFLHHRCSSDGVLLQCSFETEEAFEDACRRASRIWSKGDLGNKGRRRSASPPRRSYDHYSPHNRGRSPYRRRQRQPSPSYEPSLSPVSRSHMRAPLQRRLRSPSPPCPRSPYRGRSRSRSQSYNYYRPDKCYRTDRYRSSSRGHTAGLSSRPQCAESTTPPRPLSNQLGGKPSVDHPYRGKRAGKRNRKPGDQPGLGRRPKMSKRDNS